MAMEERWDLPAWQLLGPRYYWSSHPSVQDCVDEETIAVVFGSRLLAVSLFVYVYTTPKVTCNYS